MIKKTLFILPTLFLTGISLQGKCCSGGTCKPTVKKVQPQQGTTTTKEVIQKAYTKVANGGGICELFGGGCCGGGADLSKLIGYTKEELEAIPDANLGLGCGNPLTLGAIEKGYTVVDLGSGAGFDCLLAARKVGPTGKVIGIDMTKTMITKARENTHTFGYNNVEFRLGDIENIPVVSNSTDIVMSNCVINLAPDKFKVFSEAHRILKPGGKMYVSDIVLVGQLSSQQKKDEGLLCACVAGAMLKDAYLGMLGRAGFKVTVVEEDTEINKKWFGDDSLPIVSVKFIATKK